VGQRLSGIQWGSRVWRNARAKQRLFPIKIGVNGKAVSYIGTAIPESCARLIHYMQDIAYCQEASRIEKVDIISFETVVKGKPVLYFE
jgi:hypothetical protein